MPRILCDDLERRAVPNCNVRRYPWGKRQQLMAALLRLEMHLLD